MKNKIALAVMIVLMVTFAVYAVAAEKSVKKYHSDQNVTCMDCHGEKNPTVLKDIDCSGCHGSGDDMAKQTADLGYQNPHTSIHWGTTLPCNECHKEHKASEHYCADSCHYWPESKTK